MDILIVNCSLFNPTPSLCAMIINHFKFNSNIVSYNLSGMGCSAGVIAVSLARELLQVRGDRDSDRFLSPVGSGSLCRGTCSLCESQLRPTLPITSLRVLLTRGGPISAQVYPRSYALVVSTENITQVRNPWQAGGLRFTAQADAYQGRHSLQVRR